MVCASWWSKNYMKNIKKHCYDPISSLSKIVLVPNLIIISNRNFRCSYKNARKNILTKKRTINWSSEDHSKMRFEQPLGPKINFWSIICFRILGKYFTEMSFLDNDTYFSPKFLYRSRSPDRGPGTVPDNPDVYIKRLVYRCSELETNLNLFDKIR